SSQGQCTSRQETKATKIRYTQLRDLSLVTVPPQKLQCLGNSGLTECPSGREGTGSSQGELKEKAEPKALMENLLMMACQGQASNAYELSSDQLQRVSLSV